MFNLLRTLTPEEKKRWPQLLPELVFWYNTTAHSTTGHSPYLLLYGREPRLPIDDLVNTPLENTHPSSAEDYLRQHYQRLGRLYGIVKHRVGEAHGRLSPPTRSSRIQPGDQVLLRCQPAGRNKIKDRYGPDVFDVLSVPPEHGSAYLVRYGVTGEQRFVFGSEVRRYLRSDTGDEDNPDPQAVDLTQRSTEGPP
ncbi:hypothetical protein RRG08_053522 [Elysia crispata]|uniref:Integrase catalytic domain-containing protein n=1 Tax=Elysia crispata TaxID=231223 RepID=A0AAE0YB96_9GAST|nr:hypothetical protein RRG08_053522 [Elysia crispata]